jgi:Flp pilus assembly pilin Flp
MHIVSMQTIKAFAANEHGAVAIEYAMIAVGMFLAIIASFPSISSAVKGKFLSVGGYFATIH